MFFKGDTTIVVSDLHVKVHSDVIEKHVVGDSNDIGGLLLPASSLKAELGIK